jgi:hypothetical protein
MHILFEVFKFDAFILQKFSKVQMDRYTELVVV